MGRFEMPSVKTDWVIVVGLVFLLWLPWSLVLKSLGELRRTWTSKGQKSV
jgi:hypothetical protein